MVRGRPTGDERRARIRATGLRVTAPRLAVLRTLEGAGTPLSHADVADRLGAEGWDRATIYRNLTDLSEAGLLHRVDVGDHVWRFELCKRSSAHVGSEHPHFVCNACGDIVCLPDVTVQVSVPRGSPRALRRKDLEVQLKGRCDRCSRQPSGTVRRSFRATPTGRARART